MISWVLKNTAEYRVDTMAEVEDFHKQLQYEANENGYNLTSFSWTKKEVKSGGEVVDEFFTVKVVNVFNEAKEPENPFLKVDFPKNTGVLPGDVVPEELVDDEEW